MSDTRHYTTREPHPKINMDTSFIDTEQRAWSSSSSSSSSFSVASTPTTPTSTITDHHHHTNTNNNTNMLPPPPIPAVPAPWHLRGDVYFFPFWTSAAQARAVPAHLAYSPLEARSAFAAADAGTPAGGLGMIQILRYMDSPVGPYDEMLVVPGSFDWEREVEEDEEDEEEEDEPGGWRTKKKKKKKGMRRTIKGRNPKISRIYVSQKHSCYNGRLNWNTPKHLARFEWHHSSDGATTVKVYPHDTDSISSSSSSSSSFSEARPSAAPFFRATFTPLRLAPRFPFATRWANLFGFDTTLVMPPLPAGDGSQGELPGTRRWCSIVPQQYSRSTTLGWFDMAQGNDEQQQQQWGYENFWPGLGRWQMGVKMEDAELSFEEPIETWEGVC